MVRASGHGVFNDGGWTLVEPHGSASGTGGCASLVSPSILRVSDSGRPEREDQQPPSLPRRRRAAVSADDAAARGHHMLHVLGRRLACLLCCRGSAGIEPKRGPEQRESQAVE